MFVVVSVHPLSSVTINSTDLVPWLEYLIPEGLALLEVEGLDVLPNFQLNPVKVEFVVD